MHRYALWCGVSSKLQSELQQLPNIGDPHLSQCTIQAREFLPKYLLGNMGTLLCIDILRNVPLPCLIVLPLIKQVMMARIP